MAGDWIKMRTDLSEDPAVIDMAERLGMEEFAVVGRLHCLWSWADSQSRDGNAIGVTAKWIDRKLQRDGFAEAMVAVKWLAITSNGISLPNFENHNGATAKTRALGTNRQKKKRAADSGHDEVTLMSRDDRDESVTREEKRREEYSVPIGTGAAGAGKKPKTAAEQRKSDLWRSIKLLLVESGESKDLKAAGAIVTQAIAKFDEPTALEAIEATLHKRPAGVIAYIEAACQQAAGQRLNKQETLEAGNLAAAERFAMED
jgi:hypothetical protein